MKCVAIFVAVLCGLLLVVEAQHPCCAYNTFTGSYTGFSNAAQQPPSFEGRAYYDHLKGYRMDVGVGPQTFKIYSLPNAYYVVNTTRGGNACRTFRCTNCFKPFCVGGPGWHHNDTVTVGLTKVDKWSVMLRQGVESIVIEQPTGPTLSTCHFISDNHVKVSSTEQGTVFAFGIWYNVNSGPVSPAEFVPPSYCRPPTEETALLAKEPPFFNALSLADLI